MITANSVVTVIKIGTGTAFFSNIEPYRNRGFGLSIDDFSFSISKQHRPTIDCAVNVKQHTTVKQLRHSDLSRLLLWLRALSPRSN